MFSQKIYAEIARVTQKALDDMHNATTINQVSVILGYVTLSSRNVPGYDDELRTAIDRLLELARGENQQVLADALAALGQHMDEERPNIASQPVSTKPPPRFEIGDAVCHVVLTGAACRKREGSSSNLNSRSNIATWSGSRMVRKGSFSKGNCCSSPPIERIVSPILDWSRRRHVFREGLYRCRAGDAEGIAGSAQPEGYRPGHCHSGIHANVLAEDCPL